LHPRRNSCASASGYGIFSLLCLHFQAQEIKLPAPHQHSPLRLRQARENGTATSTNWSGYAVTGSKGSVTSVTGSWVIPAANCSMTPTGYASFWVGIDGWSSNSVEQIGTDSDCSSGTPAYYAWYEFYPHPSFYAGALTNLSVGDVMSATVSYNSKTSEFTATISDLSKSPPLSYTTTFKSHSADRSSAEWIAEAPSGSGGVLPLSDFGTFNTGYDYTPLAPGTNEATVSGVTCPVGFFGTSKCTAPIGNVWQSTMVNEKTGTNMAVPSSISSDGTSFSVEWISVGP